MTIESDLTELGAARREEGRRIMEKHVEDVSCPGCDTIWTGASTFGGANAFRCPLHKAAPALLEALKGLDTYHDAPWAESPELKGLLSHARQAIEDAS